MKTLTKWLFQPFDYIAGFPALLIGLGVMVILAGASYLTGIHFDGLLDAHINGEKAPLTYCIFEQIIPWFIFFILLYMSGRLISKTPSIRVIDIAGTTAFARIPSVILLPVTLVAQALIPPGLMDKLALHQVPVFNPVNIGLLLVVGIFAIAAIAWEVYLFYKAYSISCNIKGTKAIVSFIVVLIATEVLSKFLLNMAYTHLN